MDDAERSRSRVHGHAHFWERALTRGRFIKVAAGTSGALLAADLMPLLAHAAPPTNAKPKPIPGGFSFFPGGPTFHVSGGPGAEPSSITDLNGVVGIAFVMGTGTGMTASGSEPLLFDSDMRFMTGEYVAVDGHHYRGTFGFV
jgi:hypothetical protein